MKIYKAHKICHLNQTTLYNPRNQTMSVYVGLRCICGFKSTHWAAISEHLGLRYPNNKPVQDRVRELLDADSQSY